jgi:hypothetical protein
MLFKIVYGSVRTRIKYKKKRQKKPRVSVSSESGNAVQDCSRFTGEMGAHNGSHPVGGFCKNSSDAKVAGMSARVRKAREI